METKEKTYYGKIEGWEAYEIPIMIKCYNISLQGNVLSCRTWLLQTKLIIQEQTMHFFYGG